MPPNAPAERPRRRGRRFLLIVLAVVLAALLPLGWSLWQARDLPHIHDISTDTANPPRFVAVLALRADAPNPADYDTAVAPLQRAAYPDLAPLRLAVAPPVAFARAERAARAMGWQIVAAVPGEGRLEATATTRILRFKDDVVVRVVADGAGSRFDVRSSSRLGRGDLGANAARIRSYLSALRAEDESK